MSEPLNGCAPFDTVEEFLQHLEGRTFGPGGAVHVYRESLPPHVARDTRTIEAILTNPGTSLMDCITIMRDALNWVTETYNKVIGLTDQTQVAYRLLAACPTELDYDMFATVFAREAIGMNVAELEVFQQLVNDRSVYTPFDLASNMRLIMECTNLARVVVPT